jgi:hypothetical protein
VRGVAIVQAMFGLVWEARSFQTILASYQNLRREDRWL